MNQTIWTLLLHLIAGVAVIGALAALAATHVLTGAEVIGPIIGVAGILLGTGSSAVGASTNTPPAPTPTLAVGGPVLAQPA